MVRLKLYRVKKEQADGKDSKNVSEELSAAGTAPGRGKIFSTVTLWWYSGDSKKREDNCCILFKIADRKVLIYLIRKKSFIDILKFSFCNQYYYCTYLQMFIFYSETAIAL